jgi:hypothetical protein
MEPIEEMKKKRFRFLHKLYELSDGDELVLLGMYEEIGKDLGFDIVLSEKIARYLEGEGLIKIEAFGDGDYAVRITHPGICEVEQALSNREKPTEHFPPFNLIYVGQMIGSQIQQASPGATQLVIIREDKYEEVKEIIKSLQESIEQLGLLAQQKSDLQAEVETIKAQLSSSKPKNAIITECFKSVRNILEQTAGNVLAIAFLGKINALF